MNRDERSLYLNMIRQTDPELLIAIYRAATNTRLPAQLPRGLGFSGMIEAILQSEFAGGDAPVQYSFARMPATEPWSPAPPQRRRTTFDELTAFCSGAALVCMGLVMAAFYLFVTFPT
jgi:hypothetical protein